MIWRKNQKINDSFQKKFKELMEDVGCLKGTVTEINKKMSEIQTEIKEI